MLSYIQFSKVFGTSFFQLKPVFCGSLWYVFLWVPMTYVLVEKKWKTFFSNALFSGWLFLSLGWMPGPVIFGRVIDGTCTLWKYICGERQSCMLYDIVFFRNALHTYGIVARTLGFLVIVVLYIVFRIKKTEQWREEKPMIMEKIVNGEKHVQSKVGVMLDIFHAFDVVSWLLLKTENYFFFLNEETDKHGA